MIVCNASAGCSVVKNLFPHISTSKCMFALSTALNAKDRLLNKQPFASRAQGTEGITVLRADTQLLPQLDTLDATRSQGKIWSHPCLGSEPTMLSPWGVWFTSQLYISPSNFSPKLESNANCLQKQGVRHHRCCSCVIYYCNSCL